MALACGDSAPVFAPFRVPFAAPARTLAEGFAFQGEVSAHRGGQPRGEVSKYLPSTAFIIFTQTHDQVGNRAMGERIAALALQNALRVGVICFLLAPSIPMLFMGEEFAASTPFPNLNS